MHVERQTFAEARLKLRILRRGFIAKDGEWRAAIRVTDALQSINNRTQIFFVFFRLLQVVDRKNHDRLDSLFADPLWRGEARMAERGIEWIVGIKICQPITWA